VTGLPAERQQPEAIGSRQDLAAGGRPDPNDVRGVEQVPVTVDLHLRQPVQRDVDLFLTELMSRRIAGPFGNVIVRRVGGGSRRHVNDRHAERRHAQLRSNTAEREPLEKANRVELVDRCVRNVRHDFGSMGQLLARYLLDLVPPEHVPDLAVRAIDDGCELLPVLLLASLGKPDRGDVDELIDSLLRELGRTRPPRTWALELLVNDEASKICNGTSNPLHGASTIWGLFNYRSLSDEHPETRRQIEPFKEACMHREADAYDATADDYADIRAAAAALLNRGGLRLP
jgi:hypothetical protein